MTDDAMAHRPTLMTIHAHPDDETIGTGGTMARSVADGRRVVLVTGTRGELGEIVVPEMDTDDNHRRLGEIRAGELERAMGRLGVTEWENLGYRDSGMMGTDGNHDPRSFWQADLDEAAGRLTWLIRQYQPDVVTTYNSFGGYGHPDHIRVHDVGYAGAAQAGTPVVFEATVNRDEMRRFRDAARAEGLRPEGEEEFDPDQAADDGNPMGEPEAEIAFRVDVRAFLELKKTALLRHRSQVSDTSFFAQMPEEAFAAAFGTEWFKQRGVAGPPVDGWLVPA
jgi:LmbE family N-acetylglucosaminyl deacetylase